jgi:pimeloyl-ACP methyl ester carboxylesterase
MPRKIKLTASAMLLVPVVLYIGLWVWSQSPPGAGDPAWRDLVERNGWVRDIELNDARFHYLEAGEGPPVLLIHGYADSSYTWHKNIGPLAEAGFRVLAVDLPGLGESEIPQGFDFTPEAMARTVLAFLDQKGLDRVHLVGNSMGGNLSLYLAVNHPERVDRIVPTDPACYLPERHKIVTALARNSIAAALIRPLVGPWAYHIGLRRTYHNPDKITPQIYAQKTNAFHRPEYPDTLIRLGGAYFGETFETTSKRFGEIDAPTLLIWGETDRLVNTKYFAERLHRDLPGSQLVVIENSGHLPHQETPEIFNPRVIDFLKGN